MKKHLSSLFVLLIALLAALAPQTAQAQVNEYLKVVGSATVVVRQTGTVTEMPDLWYSIDGADWIKVTLDQLPCTLNVQGISYSHPEVGYVRFKGNNPGGFNKNASAYITFAITGGNPSIEGNVMSLLGENFATNQTIPCDYCFYALFCPNPPASFSTSGIYHSTASSTCLYHAKDMVLPATELKPYCYAYMFAYNTGLYDSPVLPATVMQPWCYAHMFEYCMNNFCSQTAYNSGTRLPNLPSQQLAEGCYAFMFNMCPSIYNGEDDWYCLPAEELAPHCYEGMFGTYRNSYYRYFKSLEIMATSLQDRCGNDIENCMRQMLNYNIMNQNAGQFGRGALNVRMYWTDWGNTDAGTAPTYGWFTGFLYSNCTFNYQKGLTPLTKVAKTNYAHTTMSSLFPYSCTLKENEFTYLTFDCKTNGGTWEEGCTFDADLRRVVRSDYKAKTVPVAPVKAGEAFKGWYTAATGGTKVDEATILNQTTAQTYYAQFGEGGDDGGEGGGDNPQDDDDTDLGNIKMTRGTLDFPTYYNSFAIEGENKAVKVRLYFNANLTTSKTDYLSSFDASKSYILPAGGTQRQIASASVAKVEYLGGAYRAAHLVATVTDTEGNIYNVDIFTNEELNYATYDDVIGTNYNYKVETSWRTCNPFHIYGTENNEMDRLIYRNPNGRHILYTFHGDYGVNLYYEVLHVQIELFPDASKPGKIPTGIYPINATQEVGTAFIGRCPDDILVYEQNQRQPYCGSFVQYELQAKESDYYPNRDVWTLRDGYVEVVNVDEKYWVHVHAYADAHRTTNEECAVIDYTACLDDEGVTYTPVAVTLSAQTEGGARLDNAATMLLKDATDWTSALPQGEYKFFTGNTLTLNAAKTGYTFSHWLINGSRVDGNNIEYTVTDQAASIVAVFTGDGNGGEGGEGGDDPETPIVSQDENVNVYQNVSKTTTKILYNLDLRQGKDGLWYKPTDMGYGIAWADRNVGANSTSAAGDYYNWSKTEVGPLAFNKTGYSGSLYVGFTLPAADDVATVKMGKDWHTPTYDEWETLAANATNGNNRLTNPDDESIYINTPPTGYYDYYDGYSQVGPWLNASTSAFYWTNEVLELNGGQLGKTNIGMATNFFNGTMEMTVGYIHLAAPVRAIYTPPFTTYTLTIRVGSYEYRYICQAGQKVTVTAIATEEGSEFVRWEEDGLTDAVRTFTMNGDMTYTAVFTEPEAPSAEDANVTVYQSVTKSTMKILYDLSAKKGKDGLWYTPVDMGYGVAWADRNIGASSPTDLGSRFRWGDPEARTSFTQVISDIHDYSTGSVLPANKDAAVVNMGTAWRTPDADEAQALRDNTLISNNNRFTNNHEPESYILLPAYGYKGAYGTYDQAYQYYWTREYATFGYSAADEANTHSCYVLARNGQDKYYIGNYDKDDTYAMIPGYGMPIRAIYVPQFNVCTLTVNVEGYQYVYLCQDGQNVTVTAVANEGYEFDRWTEDGNTEAVRTFTVTGNMTYTATFKQAVQEYNIIYKDKGGAAFSGVHASGYPTVHTYGTATILASATKEGYNFLGWFLNPDCTGSAVTTLAATAYTSDITLYAAWEKVQQEDPEDPQDDELHIILYEDKDADYYTEFSNKYNGRKANTVTYNRQFTQSKWSTLCLPFNVNTAMLSSLKMSARVYEFKYTKGDEESGLTLYFAQAKTLQAGKGYIVNANATLANKEQFIFSNVVINTEVDINSGYNIENVEGYNSQGDVYLVGTLRTGLLIGSETGNRYMGLKNNKIYYPNAEEGTNLLAYRGIFRSSVDINVPRVRIVVEDADGEQVSELEVINGELENLQAARKYIQDGILYIECNGKRYTAQGAQVE